MQVRATRRLIAGVGVRHRKHSVALPAHLVVDVALEDLLQYRYALQPPLAAIQICSKIVLDEPVKSNHGHAIKEFQKERPVEVAGIHNFQHKLEDIQPRLRATEVVGDGGGYGHDARFISQMYGYIEGDELMQVELLVVGFSGSHWRKDLPLAQLLQIALD